MNRCVWAGSDPLMVKYHDEEWGVPIRDDKVLFEFLILEGAQAGLTWSTILKKREGYRKVLDNFDYRKIAVYNIKKLDALLQDPGIIRNRLKVQSTVRNAKAFMEIQKEFGSFSKYLWAFVDNKPIQNKVKSIKDIPPTTPMSDLLSKDLKKRGMNFVGSTIIYAYMQAVGVVNDHELHCFRCEELR